MSNNKADRERGSKLLDRVHATLKQRVPHDFDALVAWQKQLREATSAVAIDRFTGVFNDKLAAMPHDTYEQKKDLCAWVNQQLREVGLAIRCPKTGLPGILHADLGNVPAVGRIQIELLGGEHHRKHTKSSPELFPLELIQEPIRAAPMARAQRLAPKSAGPNRL